MSINNLSTYEGQMRANPTTVIYTGSDTLYNGMAVCYDPTTSGLTADVTKFTPTLGSTNAALLAQRQGRAKIVIKPTLGALLAGAFAGIVVNAPPSGYVGNGVSVDIQILPVSPAHAGTRSAFVYTDENCAVGDLLGPIPGSYYFGRAVIPGCAFFRVEEATDRSATAGVVYGTYARYDVNMFPDKIGGFDDRFNGAFPIGINGFTPAEIACLGWELQGTSATCAYTSDHGGRLALTPNTTNIAQLHRGNGFSFMLDAGKSLFFRASINTGVAAVDNDIFCGLAITGASIADGSVPALDDYFGFYRDPDASALLKFAFNVDNGTDSVNSTGITPVLDTMYEVAFLLRNRNANSTAGDKIIQVFVNNTITNTFNSAADAALFCDDALLRPVFAGIGGGSARVIEIARMQVLCNL